MDINIWPMEPKVNPSYPICVDVSSDSRHSRTWPMYMLQWRVHILIAKGMRVGSGPIDDAWKAKLNVVKCCSLYQSVILLTPTVVKGRLVSH